MDYKTYLQKKNINLSEKEGVFELTHLITEARLHAGITQAELARRMGTKQPSIARAESGEQEPSISFLEKVAKAVGTYLEYPRFGFMVEKERKTNESSYLFVSMKEKNITPSSNDLICRVQNKGTAYTSFYSQDVPMKSLELIS